MSEIIIFTDGSCFGNNRKNKNSVGGMGIHFPNEELPDLSIPFNLKPCTNQRTELGAIYMAIKYLKENFGEDKVKKILIHIYTDSQYSIDCLTNWIKNWEKNNWMTSKKKPVLNSDLIKAIHRYMKKFKIIFHHTDGHTDGTDYQGKHNNIADKLAVAASKQSIIDNKKEKEGNEQEHNNTKKSTKTKKNPNPKGNSKYKKT
jgi:ribonuclease HI